MFLWLPDRCGEHPFRDVQFIDRHVYTGSSSEVSLINYMYLEVFVVCLPTPMMFPSTCINVCLKCLNEMSEHVLVQVGINFFLLEYMLYT